MVYGTTRIAESTSNCQHEYMALLPTLAVVVLGGLVIIVLVIEPKVRGFKPGQGRWIFKGDNNP
jgi:hypothetical protein